MPDEYLQIDSELNLYVCEIHSELRVIGDENERYTVEGPETYGVRRCYWSTSYVPDHLGTQRPDGVLFVIEAFGADRAQAEDKALSAAQQVADLVGFYAGSDNSSVRLRRTALVTIDGFLVEQSDYVYFDEEHRFDRNQLGPSSLRRILRRIPVLDPSVRADIQRGLRGTRRQYLQLMRSINISPAGSVLRRSGRFFTGASGLQEMG